MITATMIEYGTGNERNVEILQADKASRTAVVSPTGWDSKGMWFNNRPEWFVDFESLVDIQIKCETCGSMINPAMSCPDCGWTWKEPVSDDQDTLNTQNELQNLYRGG